ncbi:MAG: thiamine pyrophosphate-dependent dehydrogenase E1 component subunit alpha [Acidobacteriaceae bacterium]|nr:thiamine pyrophosphate-dependent dehydrogenase E1 component subunit alpha [Acidobacteriaceae bacterium]
MILTEQSVGAQLSLSLYQRMLVIRRFEESALDLFSKGLITGSTHPCIGQEAISVGACSALKSTDLVLATYRGHGVALAKGVDAKIAMAELLTRETGCCKGRGGSMHLCDIACGLLGTNGIVAAHIPIAGGVALAAQLRRSGQVTACFFGDGAACEGEFFETMNMAALWKLPLVLICENNGWAISVPVSKSQSTPDIADRAKGFGMPGVTVDGNDVLAVREAVLSAAAAARQGEGPTLIECKTVRWERHSAFSSGKPVDPEAAQRWRKADPIPRFAQSLLDAGLSRAALDEAEREATEEVRQAVEFAVNSPLPDAASVHEGVFAPPDQPLGISGLKKRPGNGLAESF